MSGNPVPSTVTPFDGYDLAALIEERAAMRGDHPLLIWEPFEGAGETWSYARFADEVARLAGGMHARGVRPGDRVLVHLENCPETLLARFACCWLGAVCVGTNALAAGPEIAAFAEATSPVAAITQPKFAALIADHAAGLNWIAVTETDAGAAAAPGTAPASGDTFRALLGDPLPRRTPDPWAPASIMFTTGTTSRSKPVLWTHANILWAARLGAYQQGLRPEDVSLLFLPVFHVVGLTWSFCPMMWAGGTVVLQPKYSASRFWPVALAHGATITAHVGFTPIALKDHPVPPDHKFRFWTVSHHQEWIGAHFNVPTCVGAYGMTELVAPAIVGDPWSTPRANSLGRPSIGYEIRVVGDDGRPVAPGSRGHLLIRAVRGMSIFVEYLGNEAATRDAFDDDGFFRTGDIVTLREGGWIEFGDRAKDMIKVGGEGVSASEVESVISAVPGVGQAAAIGKPDPVYGEVIVAFVIRDGAAPDPESGLRDAILERCRASLAKFKVPRDVHFIAEMPVIGNGKIARVKLREMAQAAEPAVEKARL